MLYKKSASVVVPTALPTPLWMLESIVGFNMRFNLKKRLFKFAEWDLPPTETDQEVSGMWELTDAFPLNEGLVESVPHHNG